MRVTINECQPTGWEERPKEYTFDELKNIFEENSVVGQLLIKCAILREALHLISLGSQNSMSSKEECGRIAKQALQRAGGWE